MESTLLDWLSSQQRLGADGRVLSWSNEQHPGYAYDEATALLASLWAWRGDTRRREALAGALEERLEERGWLGRDGISYVFDTALALPLLADPEPVARRVEEALRLRQACSQVDRPGWWSQSYGAHLLKCGFWLARVGRRAFAEQLAEDLIERCFDGERFHIHEDSATTYLHSHCYALEGLLGLGLRPDVVSAGAWWLAQQQDEDGALPGWFAQPSPWRPADVCAQALRLWTLVDREAFAEPIERATRRLAALQDPSGGIRYHDGSDDVNSWASIFALQALRWSSSPPSAEELQWLL